MQRLLDTLSTPGGWSCNSSPPLLPGYSCPPGGLCSAPGPGPPAPALTLVIPYRDRAHHAAIILPYLHTFLQLQGQRYRIVLTEQTAEAAFNRGKLLNIGFLEAERLEPAPACIVLHDVDLVPVGPAVPYTCLHRPLHLSVPPFPPMPPSSAHLDQFRYLLPYRGLVGGVLAIRADHFRAVDGFSNE
jgi:hypothetical protein